MSTSDCPSRQPERMRAYAREYRQRYLEQTRAANRRWNAEHRDHVRAYRQRPDVKARAKASRQRQHVVDPRKRIFRTAKSRAKKHGILFSIQLTDVVVPVCCPITLTPLVIIGERYSDASPSLDRIDNEKGYVPGNVRVISYKANTYKGNLTLPEIERLYLYALGQI